MCYLCLKDFEFELPVKPNLDQKKKRLLRIKNLLALEISTMCDEKAEELKQEQYELSREF